MKGDSMKNSICKMLLIVIICGAAGCAGMMPTVTHDRKGNEIIYKDKKSGHAVNVVISAPLAYVDFITRERQGVVIKGYQFDAEKDQVLVTRLHKDDFHTLTGVRVETHADNFLKFDAFTFYDQADCELVRTHIHTMSDFLIIAAYLRPLDRALYPCADWASVDDVSAAAPELLKSFNMTVDTRIDMQEK